MISLLNIINYKKIARETNTSQMNPSILEYGEYETMDITIPSDKVWKAYYEYLVFLSENI